MNEEPRLRSPDEGNLSADQERERRKAINEHVEGGGDLTEVPGVTWEMVLLDRIWEPRSGAEIGDILDVFESMVLPDYRRDPEGTLIGLKRAAMWRDDGEPAFYDAPYSVRLQGRNIYTRAAGYLLALLEEYIRRSEPEHASA